MNRRFCVSTVAGLALIPITAESLHAKPPEDAHAHHEQAQAPPARVQAFAVNSYATARGAWPAFTLDLNNGGE